MAKTKTPLRRRIVPQGTIGGISNARIKSLTRNDGTGYNTHVDLEIGLVRCDCADFTYRHAKHEPTANDTAHHCKHITRHIALCQRRDELVIVAARPCHNCGVADAKFEMCDKTGNVQIGWVCVACVGKAVAR